MSRPKCGTAPGYRYHLKYDRYSCVACSVAYKQDENARRIRRSKNRAVRVPTDVLGFLLAMVDTPTLRRAEAALGGPIVEACLEVAARGEA